MLALSTAAAPSGGGGGGVVEGAEGLTATHSPLYW